MNLKNTPRIETERLILRKFEEIDLNALYAIYKDKEVNTYLPWFPLNSVDEAKIFYEEHYVKVYQQAQGYHYAICLKDNDIPIGYVHVGMNESHDFGYGLRKEYWHQGIVSEASKAVLQQLKNDGLPFITATHDIKNPRSGEVMKKLGMKYQYSYVEQWLPKDIQVTFRMYQLNFDGQDNRVYKEYWNRYENHFVEEKV